MRRLIRTAFLTQWVVGMVFMYVGLGVVGELPAVPAVIVWIALVVLWGLIAIKLTRRAHRLVEKLPSQELGPDGAISAAKVAVGAFSLMVTLALVWNWLLATAEVEEQRAMTHLFVRLWLAPSLAMFPALGSSLFVGVHALSLKFVRIEQTH